ncbi:MAG: CRISPR-associated helicase Cas3' [Armatimonadia bacterium]|nr:CRISPR-associated helicase Cas3' [Armatimonadia bacterium]
MAQEEDGSKLAPALHSAIQGPPQDLCLAPGALLTELGWVGCGALDYRDAVLQATGDIEPFPFQARIASEGFPKTLLGPTGSGKTLAIVLAWLWRRRLHPDQAVRASTPRRLVYCLPMRVLVEQVRDCAREWVANLGLTSEVPVYTLMGGEIDRDWDRFPEQDAILVGTQDQLLSRGLNRGYAMSRYRWPVQYGLLNTDALWVMDEVQLMGPGLPTSVQLQAFREALGAWSSCRSVWMSATLDEKALQTVDAPEWSEPFTLGPEDRAHTDLADRLGARKRLHRMGLEAGAKGYAKDLAAEVAQLHQPGTLTLVIQNTVQRAQETARQLGVGEGGGPEVVLLHSSFRPPDRERILQRITADLSGDGRIVVATQAVEAGIDLSARTLVTELAPWSSVVQRCGRCNRRGEFDDAEVWWIDVPEKQSPPYEAEHLAIARESLESLDDVGIESLDTVEDRTPRPICPVIRKPDVLDLFDTTPDLSGQDVDVSPYIRQQDDHDVSVFWRELGGESDEPQPRPRPEELCSVGIGRLRNVLAKLGPGMACTWDALDSRWAAASPSRLRPGMTVMLSTETATYDPDLGWWEKAKEAVSVVPLPASHEAPEGYDANHLAYDDTPATIAEHTEPVVRAVKQLRGDLSGTDGPPEDAWESLIRAARWHDAGKAHPEFQGRLGRGPEAEGEPLAKGPYDRDASERKHFRHELASALAALAAGESFLTAYLIAAHHGKVRLSLRSMPEEKMPPDNHARFARGVWEGDVLPATDLGGGIRMPETTLDLACMEMGLSDSGEPSWLNRSLELLVRLGPFRLAYLEALLRVADWRASAGEEGGADD